MTQHTKSRVYNVLVQGTVILSWISTRKSTPWNFQHVYLQVVSCFLFLFLFLLSVRWN